MRRRRNDRCGVNEVRLVGKWVTEQVETMKNRVSWSGLWIVSFTDQQRDKEAEAEVEAEESFFRMVFLGFDVDLYERKEKRSGELLDAFFPSAVQ